MMQRTGTITFDYDGDEQRIRKTTPEQETLYFGHLYERVTDLMSGEAEHRYYVHSPERVIAIVTRGGTDPGTRYVHGDHLGSMCSRARMEPSRSAGATTHSASEETQCGARLHRCRSAAQHHSASRHTRATTSSVS